MNRLHEVELDSRYLNHDKSTILICDCGSLKILNYTQNEQSTSTNFLIVIIIILLLYHITYLKYYL